jgi:hypothetical protein
MQRCTTGTVLSGCVSLVAICLLSTMQIRAQGEMLWTVIGAGGTVDATDGVNRFAATLGQPIIGIVANGGMQLYQGFWVPLSLSTTSVDDGGGEAVAGGAFRLTNYPNPFSSTTTINYRLDEPSRVSLEIFDLLGKKIIDIAGGVEEAGEQSHQWNGFTSAGVPAAGGYYLYVLTVEPLSGGNTEGNRVRSERRQLLLVR